MRNVNHRQRGGQQGSLHRVQWGTITANDKAALRSKDVAWILDIGPDEVVELVWRGKLKATKVGRLWRYRLSDVESYKRQNGDALRVAS